MGVPRGILFAVALSVAPVGWIGAQAADTTALRIAVLTWYVDSLLPSRASPVAAICLSVSNAPTVGAHPVEAFADELDERSFAALPASRIPLHRRSACSTRPEFPQPVVESVSGRPAVVVTVGPPRDSHAERTTLGLQVHGSGLGGIGWLCDVAWSSGKWRVTGCRETWVS